VRTANQGTDETAAAEEARRTEIKSDLKEICEHYDGDLDCKRLQRQLAVLRDTCKDKIKTVWDVCTALAAFPSLQEVFSEISKLVKLFLVIPASSATAEKSFSAMRRLKTYLRPTMTNERLHSIMILHTHNDMLDDVDDNAIMDEFVCNENRKDMFGTRR
jgi:hypothetical protein